MDNRYGRLAALVYELDKPVGHSFGDVEFYIERRHALGSRIVLEPAAGNGRVLIPLAQAGFRMTGSDRSPHMLDYLHKNCARWTVSAPIFENSLEGFDLGARFDAVILPAGSLQLLDNPASASDFLRRCRLHLRSGGHLLFDLDAASAFETPQPSYRRWRLEDGGEITLTETVTSCQPATQRVEYSHRYEHLRDGRPVSSEVEAFCLRWWRVNQIIPVLHANGFSDIIASGAYRWKSEPAHGEGSTLLATAA